MGLENPLILRFHWSGGGGLSPIDPPDYASNGYSEFENNNSENIMFQNKYLLFKNHETTQFNSSNVKTLRNSNGFLFVKILKIIEFKQIFFLKTSLSLALIFCVIVSNINLDY